MFIKLITIQSVFSKFFSISLLHFHRKWHFSISNQRIINRFIKSIPIKKHRIAAMFFYYSYILYPIFKHISSFMAHNYFLNM